MEEMRKERYENSLLINRDDNVFFVEEVELGCPLSHRFISFLCTAANVMNEPDRKTIKGEDNSHFATFSCR